MSLRSLTFALLAATSLGACASNTETGTNVGEAEVKQPAGNTGCVSTMRDGGVYAIEFTRPDRAKISKYDKDGRILEKGTYEYSVKVGDDAALELYSGGSDGGLDFRIVQTASGFGLIETKYVAMLENPTAPRAAKVPMIDVGSAREQMKVPRRSSRTNRMTSTAMKPPK